MNGPYLIDRHGDRWVYMNGAYYIFPGGTVPWDKDKIVRVYGPLKEENIEMNTDMKITTRMHITCPHCEEPSKVTATLSNEEDGLWKSKIVCCEAIPMQEPDVGTLVTVGKRHFVRAIRKGINSSHDWIDLERQSHTRWEDILELGKPTLGYYGDTLEY